MRLRIFSSRLDSLSPSQFVCFPKFLSFFVMVSLSKQKAPQKLHKIDILLLQKGDILLLLRGERIQKIGMTEQQRIGKLNLLGGNC